MKPTIASLLEKFNTNAIKAVVTSKVKLINNPMKKLSGTSERIFRLKTRAWVFMYELEGDMKDWFKGVKEDVPGLINKAGFKVEVHEVATPDGYLLQLHRIPPAPGAESRPVFLQHGLLCSSACWVTNGRQSLAFVLADLGFDVWLGNFRGNAYSRRHISLDPDVDHEFWKFSIHELGTYDLPASLSKCLSVSGSETLSYIGHSMGTTTFIAMCSSNLSVADKVDLAILLAPVVEPCLMKNTIARFLAPAHGVFWAGLETIGVQEIIPNWTIVQKLVTVPWLQFVFAIILRHKIDSEATAVMKQITGQFKTGTTSIYTVLHYCQMITKKSFQAFHWGSEKENLINYNSPDPPTYELGRVTVPSVVFWSDKDSLACDSDVSRLQKELPNMISSHKLDYRHIDYLWGEKADLKLYKHIGDILDQNRKGVVHAETGLPSTGN